MTVPRLWGLQKYWRKYPPVHKMLAVRWGVKEARETVEQDGSSFEAFKQLSIVATQR